MAEPGSAGGMATTGDANARIDAVDLFVLPVAVNWDNVPGPDGVAARIMLYRSSDAQPVAMTRGTLDFLLFEGRLGNTEIMAGKPHVSWSYTPGEMVSAVERNIVGIGYTLRLGWGPLAPRTDAITLVARYMPERGSPVFSAPVTMLMNPIQ